VGAGELGELATSNPPPAVDHIAEHKAKLSAALHDSRFRFRKITALAECIGQPESYTVELLRTMGARQERDRAHLWGAVDVVGAGRGAGRPRSYEYAADENDN